MGCRAAPLGAAIQLVPYGRDHSDPPVTAEPEWDSPRTRELFFRACRDCHSNETRWLWYASLAPISWLLRRDVDAGRSHFDDSEWDREHPEQHGDEAAEMLRSGEMPLWYYLPLHPEADLTATFGDTEGGHHHGALNGH